jgi:hypothetical protein
LETAAFVVSLIAITAALVSLSLAIRADRRQARAERREEAQAVARRSGRPSVLPRGGSGGPTAERVSHSYQIRNAGEATITELFLWIEDGEGNTVSTVAGGLVAIAPQDAPVHMAVEVPQPRPARQILMVKWRDNEGEHVEPTGIEPRQNM